MLEIESNSCCCHRIEHIEASNRSPILLDRAQYVVFPGIIVAYGRKCVEELYSGQAYAAELESGEFIQQISLEWS